MLVNLSWEYVVLTCKSLNEKSCSFKLKKNVVLRERRPSLDMSRALRYSLGAALYRRFIVRDTLIYHDIGISRHLYREDRVQW